VAGASYKKQDRSRISFISGYQVMCNETGADETMSSIDSFVRLIVDSCHRIVKARIIDERLVRRVIINDAKNRGYKVADEDDVRKVLWPIGPFMDVVIEIDNELHAAELKVIRKEALFGLSLNGWEQTLLYTLNGIDYAWLVQYYVKGGLLSLKSGQFNALTLIEKTLDIYGIQHIGLLALDLSVQGRCNLAVQIRPVRSFRGYRQDSFLNQRRNLIKSILRHC